MFKLAVLIWMMLGTTLGGIAVTAIITMPSLAEHTALLIPVCFIAGAILAMPISYAIAKKIGGTAAG